MVSYISMINGKRIAVVMAAYNAERALKKTARESLACTKIDRVVSSEAAIAGAPHPPSGLPEWLQTQARPHGAAYSSNTPTPPIALHPTFLPNPPFPHR